LSQLQNEQNVLNKIVAEHDMAGLEELKREPGGKKQPVKSKVGSDKREVSLTGIRSYRSSDQYEVLVGRAARDNDRLTFRIARPHDYWLHAADYPGSHVVVVNHQRQSELPHRTLVEAAQLAAFFSQARADTKVNVHCTQRKFITKPKGAAPGLVRLSQFRTLIVEPREALERIK
jgi:predicted ribosome quality control (RQC) complex YloA/Tae2 family protein